MQRHLTAKSWPWPCGSRQIFIFTSHADVYFDSEKAALSLIAVYFCCFFSPGSPGWPALGKLNASSPLENLCACSLRDSSSSLSLASSFHTYSTLPVPFHWTSPLFFYTGTLSWLSFFKRFYLFIFREGKGGKKRGRETLICGCLSHAPYWGPGLQPRHVPWLGIEPVTLWFAGYSQSTKPHQPRLVVVLFSRNLIDNDLYWWTCGTWEMQRLWSQTKLGVQILACCLLVNLPKFYLPHL